MTVPPLFLSLWEYPFYPSIWELGDAFRHGKRVERGRRRWMLGRVGAAHLPFRTFRDLPNPETFSSRIVTILYPERNTELSFPRPEYDHKINYRLGVFDYFSSLGTYDIQHLYLPWEIEGYRQEPTGVSEILSPNTPNLFLISPFSYSVYWGLPRWVGDERSKAGTFFWNYGEEGANFCRLDGMEMVGKEKIISLFNLLVRLARKENLDALKIVYPYFWARGRSPFEAVEVDWGWLTLTLPLTHLLIPIVAVQTPPLLRFLYERGVQWEGRSDPDSSPLLRYLIDLLMSLSFR